MISNNILSAKYMTIFVIRGWISLNIIHVKSSDKNFIYNKFVYEKLLI